MEPEPKDRVTVRVEQRSWRDDGLAADRAKHRLRNGVVLVLTLVTLYMLIGDLGGDGTRSTTRQRHGGAGAMSGALIVLIAAVSLWRMPIDEASRLLTAPDASVGLLRSTLPFSVALFSGGALFLAASFDAERSLAALASLAVFLPSAALTISTGRWGRPQALIPPPLRGR